MKTCFKIFLCIFVASTAWFACSVKPLDTSGTWVQTGKWEGCGGSGKTPGAVIEVKQQGNLATAKFVTSGLVMKGTVEENVSSYKGVRVPNGRGDFIIYKDFKLIGSKDGNSYTGIINWSMENSGCEGVSEVSGERQLD